MHQLWIQMMLIGCLAAPALAATVTLRERQQLDLVAQLEASLPAVGPELWPPGWTIAPWQLPATQGRFVIGAPPSTCEPLPEWPLACLSVGVAAPLPEEVDLAVQLAMARLQSLLPLPAGQPEPLGSPSSPQDWALQELEQRLLAEALEQSGPPSQQAWQQALSARQLRLHRDSERDQWEQSLMHREGLPWALALDWLDQLPDLSQREAVRPAERRQTLIQQLRTPLDSPFARTERLRWMGAAHTLLLARFEAQWQHNLRQGTGLLALARRSTGTAPPLAPPAQAWLAQRIAQLQSRFAPAPAGFASPPAFWAAPGRKLCLEVKAGELSLEPTGLSAHGEGVWLTSPGSYLAVGTPAGPLRFSGVWLITAMPPGWRVCGQLPPALSAAWPPPDLGQVRWFWAEP